MAQQGEKNSEFEALVIPTVVGFMLVIGYVILSSIGQLDLAFPLLAISIFAGAAYFVISRAIKAYQDQSQRKYLLSGKWIRDLGSNKQFNELVFSPWPYIGIVVVITLAIDPELTVALFVIAAIVFGLVKVLDRPKKCPKCDSQNLKVIKPGFRANSMQLWTMGLRKAVNLNVCRDCGFSWEDR